MQALLKRDHYGHYRMVTCDVCSGDGSNWEKDGEIIGAEEPGATVQQCPCCYGNGKVRRYLEDSDVSNDG